MAGKVSLVGAGPGDSGLLTLKGKETIEQADVVLYDRLVSTEILAMIPDGVRTFDVGKQPGSHPVNQDKINQMLISYAKEGKLVVRLKGGDPYLFGRGAEELEAVAAYGIDFEVIPGITSAFAVPASAGIPVTHRNYSSSVHVITAHKKKDMPIDINFESLVKQKGTLVFLMGVHVLNSITVGLMHTGMHADTPACLIMCGTTHQQKKLLCNLGEICKRAMEAGVHSPSVLVVGDVCRLSNILDTNDRRPLAHLSVMLTRPADRNCMLADQLKQLGCSVAQIPMIATKTIPMDKEIINKLPRYNWIVFTSQAGVKAFIHNISKAKVDIRQLGGCKIAAVGPKTEQVLQTFGLLADYVPSLYDLEHLLAGLQKRVTRADYVLLYRSNLGRDILSEGLSSITHIVDDVTAYETTFTGRKEYLTPERVNNAFDYILFTSGSAVDSFGALAGDTNLSGVKAICIGEQTGKKAKQYGMDTYISREATTDSMVKKLLLLEGKKQNEG